MDCFVLPNGTISGELVHYNPNKIKDFRNVIEPDFFTTLNGLLDSISPSPKIEPRNSTVKLERKVKMVIARLQGEERKHWDLKSKEEYLDESPETKIWNLVNSVFQKRLKAIGVD